MKNQETAAIIKVSSLGIIGGLFSFLVFNFFHRFLTTFNFEVLWLFLVSLVLFLIVFALQVFFIRDFPLLLGVSAVQSIIPLAVFYPYFQAIGSIYFVGVSIFLFFILLVLGARRGFSNLENSVKIKFFSTAHSAVTKAIIGTLIVMVIFSYFYLFYLGNFSSETGEIVFDKSLETLEPALKIWFPGVTFNMEMDEVLTAMSMVQINRSKVDLLQQGVRFEQLPESIQADMISDVKGQLREIIENLTGKTINSGQTFNTYLFESFSDWLNSFSEGIHITFEIGSIILLFLALKGISFFVYIPVELISYLLFKLMVLVGFANVGIKDVSKEDVVI